MARYARTDPPCGAFGACSTDGARRGRSVGQIVIYQAPDVGTGAMVNETPNAWFVQTKGSLQTFRSQADRAGASYTERFTYSSSWNGLSVRASAKDAGVLSRLPSVQAIYPVLTSSSEDRQRRPDLATAIDMTGARVDADRSRLHGRRRQGGRDGHGHRLPQPGSRRLLRRRLPGRRPVGTSSATRSTPTRQPAYNPVPSPDAIRTTATGTARTSPASSARRPPRPAASRVSLRA